MTRTFQQTDMDAVCGEVAMCSGLALGNDIESRQCIEGAVPRANNALVRDTSAPTTIAAYIFFELVPNAETWEAGEWTVQINVVTGNVNFDWRRTYICRASNACVSLETVGSKILDPSVHIFMGMAGLKQMHVTGSLSTGNVSDKAYIVCGFQTTGTGTQGLVFKPNAEIITPLNDQPVREPRARIVQPRAQSGVLRQVRPTSRLRSARATSRLVRSVSSTAAQLIGARAQSSNLTQSIPVSATTVIRSAQAQSALVRSVHSLGVLLDARAQSAALVSPRLTARLIGPIAESGMIAS